MVNEADLVAAESALGVHLPDDYRAFLSATDGIEELMPDAYLVLWPLTDVVEVSRTDACPYPLRTTQKAELRKHVAVMEEDGRHHWPLHPVHRLAL